MVATMTHRLQLLLDEERYQRVAEIAREQHTSVAEVIRGAIDRGLGTTAARRAAAARAILAAEPMDVPEDPADLKREIDEMHDHRVP
jgi:hypothetical protein